MGRLIILNTIILIGIYSCRKELRYHEIQKIIDETKQEFAPDSRTAIFDIRILTSKPVILQGETSLPEAKNSLIEHLKDSGIDVEDQIAALPGEELGKDIYGIINVSVANLRSHPKHSAELATQALLGTPVNILKQTGGWLLIQTPDQYISWTNAESLVRLDKEQLDTWKKAQKVIYLNTYGFSLTEDGSDRISDLVTGNVLLLEEENKDSWGVIYPDGRKAKISKDEAENFQSWYDHLEISDQSIASAAKDLTGIPYLWGGTSSKGLDCSGFTKMVYFLHGLVLPRDASQQVLMGELIDRDKNFANLRVGDLLFFGSVEADQTENVVHTGLWLGNNKFIHASGDVHISSMDSLDENFDEYNYNRYLRSKRIIGANHATPKVEYIYF